MKTKELHSQLLEFLTKALEGEKNISVKVYENSSGTQFTLEEFFAQYNPEEIQKGLCNANFRIDINGEVVAAFALRDMYNCSGIIVASDLFVSKDFRHRGIGTRLTKFMMDFSEHYGYGVIQATDKESNEDQFKIFTKLGWTRSHVFDNPKTRNRLIMWLYNIKKDENK